MIRNGFRVSCTMLQYEATRKNTGKFLTPTLGCLPRADKKSSKMPQSHGRCNKPHTNSTALTYRGLVVLLLRVCDRILQKVSSPRTKLSRRPKRRTVKPKTLKRPESLVPQEHWSLEPENPKSPKKPENPKPLNPKPRTPNWSPKHSDTKLDPLRCLASLPALASAWRWESGLTRAYYAGFRVLRLRALGFRVLGF